MHRIDEYKDKIDWDIWEDIQWIDTRDIVWENAEKNPHVDPNIPIYTHILKRYKKT